MGSSLFLPRSSSLLGKLQGSSRQTSPPTDYLSGRQAASYAPGTWGRRQRCSAFKDPIVCGVREARNRQTMAADESRTKGGGTERGVAPWGCGTEAGTPGDVKDDKEFAKHGGRCREQHFTLKAWHVQWYRGRRGRGRSENSEKSSPALRHRLACGCSQSPPPRAVLNSHLHCS